MTKHIDEHEGRRNSQRNGLKVKFRHDGEFRGEIERRVDAYFASRGISSRDNPSMYLKTGVHLLWLVGSYLALTLWASSVWSALPLAVSLGLAMAGIGFNVMHDGNHGAYSRRRWVNRLTALTLDGLGGSSYMWGWKHNVFHHTYPNIQGADDDIDPGFFARLAPDQPHRWMHRFQYLYIWPLYGLLALKWQLFDDFQTQARGELYGHDVPRARGWNRVIFFGGKLFFYFWTLALPVLLGHRPWVVLLFFLVTSFTLGVTLAIVFQLAHCVPEAGFPLPSAEGRMENDWATHQVETAVDFARRNPVATWFLGGLNFQIEHHLLPRVCHVHYPAVSEIVEDVCREYGVRHRSQPTFRAALASHARWLYRMGRPEPVSTAREAVAAAREPVATVAEA